MIRYSIERNVGKSSKDTRILGRGSSFSNKTTCRFNIPDLEKGKAPMTEEELEKEEVCVISLSLHFVIISLSLHINTVTGGEDR